MSEKALIKDGLRIQKKELNLMQDQILLNLSRLTTVALSIPSTGAVLTTKSTAGVLGSALRVDVVANVPTVRAGTGLTFDGTYINVPSDTIVITGTFSNNTSRKVILHWAASSIESSTVSVASGGVNLTFSSSVSAIYSPGDYIRISNSANGNNGTFRLLTVSGTTATLQQSTGGTAESGLAHSQAGKFFPGYPTSGTTDIAQHDSFTLTYEDPATYTLLSNEIYLATLAKDGSGNISVSTDARVALAPNMIGRIITDSDVSTTAAIQESKIALSAATITAKTQAHLQNTDTYTTSATFRVKGATGPRVLTTDDMLIVQPGGPPVNTAPSVLAQEVNYHVSFYNTLASPDSSSFTSAKVPALRATWGINGTGTYATINASSGTFSLTSAHDFTGTSLGSNALVDHLLVDSAGNKYKITASAAVSTSTAFTVTVAVDNVGSQPNPANGVVLIRNAAASYQINVVDTVSGDIQSFQVPVTANGSLPLVARPMVTGIKGRSYRIDLVSTNSSLTPTTQTLSITVPWGQTTTSVINVPSSSITTHSSSGAVTFDWPAPANFDSAIMDYAIAYSLTDQTAPSFYNLVAYELSDGGGQITIPATAPQVVWIRVQVRDLSGNFLSDAAGEIVGYPTPEQTNTVQVATYGFHINQSGGGFPDFVTQTDGTKVGVIAYPNFLGMVGVVGIELQLIYANPSSGHSAKARAWQYGQITNGVSSGIITGTGNVLTTTTQTNLGRSLVIGVEMASGATPYDIQGVVVLHYVNVSSIQAPTHPVF